MMMKKVFGLLSLLLCLVAVAQGDEVLQNPDMNGCENGDVSPLTSWTGGQALSYSVQSRAGFFANEAAGDTCCALLFPFSGSDSITQTITITARGLYDFSSSIACIAYGDPSQCTMSLTIDGKNIPLTGAFVGSTFPSIFLPVTASAIFLTVGTHPLVISFVDPTTNAGIAVTSASLMPSGAGSGDPHMVGFQGQRFDYIGEPGQIINLLTDPDLQMNTKLGLQKQSANMFFSGPVMMEMAFMTRGHTVMINAGGYQKDEIGFVTVDGVLLPLGHSFLDGILSVVFTPLNALAKDLGMVGDNDHIVAQVDVKLEGLFEFRVFMIENGRDPKNPDHWMTKYPRRFLDFNASLLDQDRRPHGVLGQTAAPLSKERSVGEWTIEGNDQDYVVKDGITGTQFTFNQF